MSTEVKRPRIQFAPLGAFCDAHVFEYPDQGFTRVFIVTSEVHKGNGFVILDVRTPGHYDTRTTAAVAANELCLSYQHVKRAGDPDARVYVHPANGRSYDSPVYDPPRKV